MSKSAYLSLLLASVVLGCRDDVATEKTSPLRSYLVSFEKVNTLALSDLRDLATFAGQSQVSELVRHGVDTYNVVYETLYKGKPLRASGLIYVPVGLSSPAPLITLQHGTTFLKERAPSVSNEFSGMEYFASAGYVALMPDYIGYGASASVSHPYYDRQHSAGSVIDFIHAAREFLQKEGIVFNQQLFVAGYSEGGYVALATAKELETNPAHGLTVTAVAAGAGGYDLSAMLESITSVRYYSYPAYLAFVLMSYNTTYEWNKPPTYFFRERYAKALKTYMTGEYDGWQINSRLTTDVTQLLNPNFLSGLNDPNGEQQLKEALRENTITGWNTSIPVKLFHGTRDEIIPVANSERTLAQFRASGGNDVTLTIIPGGTHGSAFIPMLRQFIPWFETLRNETKP